MATYTIRALYKKSAECRDVWIKDRQVVILTEVFGWGMFTRDSDKHPIVDLENLHGYEVYSEGWELVSLADSWYIGWGWPEDMPESERQRMQAAWEDNSYQSLESQGWELNDSEVWLSGPLVLTNQDTGEEWSGSGLIDGEVDVREFDDHVDYVENMPDSESEVTDWFPGDIDPVYVGQYQLLDNTWGNTWPFPVYGNWDGEEWSQNGRVLSSVTGWRGLAQDPATA